MAIRRIVVSNFKSFRHLDVELASLNVLIGANASGKSNFIQVFKFLRDVQSDGLDNAVSLQGGAEYLRNVGAGLSDHFSLTVVCDLDCRRVLRPDDRRPLGVSAREGAYSVVLGFGKKEDDLRVVKDELTVRCDFFRLAKKDGSFEEGRKLGAGRFVLANKEGSVSLERDLPDHVTIDPTEMLPTFFLREKLLGRKLLLETPVPLFAFGMLAAPFTNIAIYDFDPKLSKQARPASGKRELEPDGGNLAIVLKGIRSDRDKKRKFANLIADILPFVQDVDVDKIAERSLFLKLREAYAPSRYLPAWLISDGTLNVAALIVALYFEEKPIVIIEEPERNIHPFLISKVVSMLKEVSAKRQVIVTTHNPELVKHADLDNLLLASRDKEGFSTIVRPGEKAQVRGFLESEIGIDELYVQDLLGV